MCWVIENRIPFDECSQFELVKNIKCLLQYMWVWRNPTTKALSGCKTTNLNISRKLFHVFSKVNGIWKRITSHFVATVVNQTNNFFVTEFLFSLLTWIYFQLTFLFHFLFCRFEDLNIQTILCILLTQVH